MMEAVFVIWLIIGVLAIIFGVIDFFIDKESWSTFFSILFGFMFCWAVLESLQSPPKTEYKIELINQQQVRINNDTIQFENIEEYIEKDNL